MTLTWLHVSDFHFREGDPYDRDVVLRALVRSVQRYREEGRAPDLIFATGDVAYSGKPAEYEPATRFFDALLAAAGLDKRRLFVVPGNHDVNRNAGRGLARTLESREEADGYFAPDAPWFHLRSKLAAYKEWFDEYFKGIRTLPDNSTCGPVEAVELAGRRLAVLPISSALFCQGDDDHERLWVGRRCLDAALADLKALGADLNVALIHHPVEWLAPIERPNIKASLQAGVDFVLRGHLHDPDVESVVSVAGGNVRLAAGAAYDTRKWPNRAFYCRVDGGDVTVFPIRYEDQPQEIWTVDPSLFPTAPDFEQRFPIPRLAAQNPAGPPATASAPTPAAPVPPARPAAPSTPRFRSNIPSRKNLPFVGRDSLLAAIRTQLEDATRECVLVLAGPAGAGKSELAREFARWQRDRYPGGTFWIDATAENAPLDLALIGKDIIGLEFPADLPINDQCVQALLTLGATNTLLIYDNVAAPHAIEPWLPPAGARCHVLITTTLEHWPVGWALLPVAPLSRASSIDLVQALAGPVVTERFGALLADQSGGLPVQIVPAAATLAYEQRRGRLDAATLTLANEAQKSFRLVYERLDTPAQLLLHAAARLNPQRILRGELTRHLATGATWTVADVQRHLDACMDLHLLTGAAELRMHQLFARFVRESTPSAAVAADLAKVAQAGARRLVEIAGELAEHPANAELAATLLTYPLAPADWPGGDGGLSVTEGETLGRALYETGQFEAAQPWFERAVAAAEQGDVHGRIDHASLGRSLHQVGYCLSSRGEFEAAQPWFERAVAAAEQGDVHGRIDHASLGSSLHLVGDCLSSRGQFEAAQPWFERAVAAAEQGDVHGRVDQESLGISQRAVAANRHRLGQ